MGKNIKNPRRKGEKMKEHKKTIVAIILLLFVCILTGCMEEEFDMERYMEESRKIYEYHRPYIDNASWFEEIIISYSNNVTFHLTCVDYLLNSGNYSVALIELQLADSNYSQMNNTLTEFNRWYMDVVNKSHDLELDPDTINYHVFTKLHDSRGIRKDREQQLSYKHKVYNQLIEYEVIK